MVGILSSLGLQDRPNGRIDRSYVSDLYVDESSQTKHRYLALGGIIVPAAEAPTFDAAISAARLPELPNGEMAWTKVSSVKLAAYKRVVDRFFETKSYLHPIEFHSLYVDTTKIRDNIHNAGSRETGFNKEVYQLGVKFAKLHRSRYFHLYLDSRTTKSSVEELRLILNRGMMNRHGDNRDWPFRRVQFRDSSKSNIIQLTDILLGSITYHLNGHRNVDGASAAKCELSDYVLRRANVHSALIGTGRAGRFTIWPRRLR